MTKYLPKSAGTAMLLVASAATMMLAGCGSSGGGSGSSNTVLIRSIDTVPNGGNSQIRINNGTVEGQQTADTVSDYRYLQPGQSAFTFSFDTNSLTYPTTNTVLSGGTSYSVILFGRADITDPTDVRYPSLTVSDDAGQGPPPPPSNARVTPAVGSLRLRIVNAAADANPVNLIIDGDTNNYSYKEIEFVAGTAGSHTVSVVDSVTSVVLVPPTTVNFPNASQDTLLILEPTVSPITYSVKVVSDN